MADLIAPGRSIQKFPVTDQASWHALREQDVTASVAGALLGIHEYVTPYALWALKTGRLVADPEESEPMQRGRLLEPVAIQLMREKHPEWKVEQPGIYLRDTEARIGATPDCFVTCPKRGLGNVQIKSVEASIFRKKWHTEDGALEPPLWIVVQSIIEAALSGARWAAVAPLVVSYGLEMPIIEIPLHAGIMDRLRDSVAEFWQMVADGKEPDPDYGRDGATIARLYEADRGTEVDLSSDNHLPILLEERDVLKSEIKAREERVSEIDNEFKAKIGTNAVAYISGGRRVSWKTQHRKGYTVDPNSFRVLRYSK